VLAPVGLALSEEKTRICTSMMASTSSGSASGDIPSKAARNRPSQLADQESALHGQRPKCARPPAKGRHQPLAVLLDRLAPILWGWTTYFQHGVSKGDLRLPAPFHLATGTAMASPQTPESQLETDPPPLPTQLVADGR
jgi:hypothetical protein